MSDFTKTICAILLTAALSSAATTSKLSADIASVDRMVIKIDNKLEKIDERVREVEIKQGSYLASNHN